MKWGMVGYLARLLIFLTLLFPSVNHASIFSILKCPFTPEVYVGGFGGINGGYDFRCKHIKTNRGYYAGIRVGNKFFSYIRLEGELAWQWNEVNSLNEGTIQFDHVRGDINVWSVMANGIFDFPFNCCLPARPYLGGGIGYAYTSGHWSGSFTPPAPTVVAANPVPANNTNENVFSSREHFKSNLHNGGFAWQVIAGLNFSVCYRIVISLEYRFFKAEGRISNHKFGLALAKNF